MKTPAETSAALSQVGRIRKPPRAIAWSLAGLLLVARFGRFDAPSNVVAKDARNVVLSVKFSFRDALTLSGSFDDIRQRLTSCANVGTTGPNGIFEGPTTGYAGPKDFGGHKVRMAVYVFHYHGPGTYNLFDKRSGPESGLHLTVDDDGYFFDQPPQTGAQAVVRPDASGSVSFGLHGLKGKLIGTIDWICKVR